MNALGAHNQDFRTLAGLWPEVAGKHALDMGCGSGLYTRELAARGAHIVGVDLDVEGLRRARNQEGGDKCHWVCADARYLPFREECFSLAVCVEVLTHIETEERRKALVEVSRVLESKGTFFFSLHNCRRLTLASWLRLRRASKVYHTPNLSVWPTTPGRVRSMLSNCKLHLQSRLYYANFHSRFTHNFYSKHPQWARLLIQVEDGLSRIPLLRRLAITFIGAAKKDRERMEGEID
jgi:ubiquinone/menaquinone biosynthesis C-methylase UbiE